MDVFPKKSNKYRMKKLLTLYLIWSSFQIFAQEISFKYNDNLKIIQNGLVLPNAWAGGLNTPQFSTCRLNNDGFDDLVVFDRTAQKIATFLAVQDTNGKFSWKYAPEYEPYFPKIQNWMLLVDYDQDGKKDIFTHSPAGLRVFRNISTDTKIAWELVADPLYSVGFSGKINLSVTATDIPAIVDCDNDGDIDVLMFDSSGDFVEYHRNNAVEKYQDPKRLEFVKIGYCWGNFLKEHCKDFRFDIECGDTPAGESIVKASPDKVLHSGNSLLLLDLNGDNKKDVLFGHITCTNIASMLNQGTEKRAIFTNVSYVFPQDAPIDFPIFPAVYYEDLDFDGIKDLVAAPNGYDNALQTVDFQQSAWFYKNTAQNGNANFVFQSKNFLQNTMLDLGENTSPVLVDIDGDGDKDLLVGNGGLRGEQGFRASIYLFENKGNGSFELTNTDFLGLSSSLQLFDIRPFISDIDGDGIEDFGFSSNSFKGMEIRYIINKAAKGKPWDIKLADAILLPTIPDFIAGESVVFFDYDKDGIKDIIHGTGRGNLRFFKNKGTNKAPSYTLQNDDLGRLEGNYVTGNLYLTIADVNLDGKADLITGSREGNIKIYKSLLEQNPTAFVADTSLIWNATTARNEQLHVGSNLSIAVADLDNDLLPDMVVGNNTGGLRFLKNTSNIVVTGTEETYVTQVYPNPTNKYLYIKSVQAGLISLLDLKGNTVLGTKSIKANAEESFDMSGLNTGVYFLKFEPNQGQVSTIKVLLQK